MALFNNTDISSKMAIIIYFIFSYLFNFCLNYMLFHPPTQLNTDQTNIYTPRLTLKW